MPYTILIVDDSAPMRHSLRCCIEENTDWRVCGEAENGEVAVEKVKELHPDSVVLDLQMPVMNGLEAAREINAVAPETAMVMFTLHDSDQLAQVAHAAGIRDVLSKCDRVSEHLLESLEEARPEKTH
jgi:DNA-binding NarL/FixJ family response regulator